MNDVSFRRVGGACAVGIAICGVAYPLTLFLDTNAAGMTDRLLEANSLRGLNRAASLLLALSGVLLTFGVTAVAARVDVDDRHWMRWATGIGVIGGAMTAAHGYWDYVRVPVLLSQWGTGLEGRQAAIAAFSGLANPVDPRGLGALLFTGVFVLIVSQVIVTSKDMPAWVGWIGLLYGALLVVAFALGLLETSSLRVALTGLAMGVAGPIWWLAVGWELLRT